jgi:AraC-like DNA-binding protein
MFRELLITTGQPIGTLAPAAGFPTLGHLYRLFQRTYGMAPQEDRAQFRGTQPGAEKAPPRREFPPVADLAHGGFGEV